MLFHKHRIEALSDGVFAIAMTLLILDLKPPLQGVAPLDLWPALAQEGHEWISFLVTFTIACIFWVAQHHVFGVIEEMRTESLVFSFVTLGFVSVLPFTTSLWGHHIAAPLALMLYFVNQFCIALALALKLEIATRRGQVRLTMASDLLRLRLWLMCLVMGGAILGAKLLPIRFVGLIALGLGLAARALRSKKERKWRSLEAGKAVLPSIES